MAKNGHFLLFSGTLHIPHYIVILLWKNRKTEMVTTPTFLRLQCGVQPYPWGAKAAPGRVPFIADLLAVPAPVDGKPFAELWIGAHPNLPATLPDGSKLTDFIRANPAEVLGNAAAAQGIGELPFLLKVLSCDQALSIQAHPDKDLAKSLHAQDPQHYPDPNPKPEIAIAVTPFDALAQFRPAADIRADAARLNTLGAFFASVGLAPVEQRLGPASAGLAPVGQRLGPASAGLAPVGQRLGAEGGVPRTCARHAALCSQSLPHRRKAGGGRPQSLPHRRKAGGGRPQSLLHRREADGGKKRAEGVQAGGVGADVGGGAELGERVEWRDGDGDLRLRIRIRIVLRILGMQAFREVFVGVCLNGQRLVTTQYFQQERQFTNALCGGGVAEHFCGVRTDEVGEFAAVRQCRGQVRVRANPQFGKRFPVHRRGHCKQVGNERHPAGCRLRPPRIRLHTALQSQKCRSRHHFRLPVFPQKDHNIMRNMQCAGEKQKVPVFGHSPLRLWRNQFSGIYSPVHVLTSIGNRRHM